MNGMQEMHQEKIQSTFRSKGESGKHTASTPLYGYIKDERDKNKWIVDEKAAEVVRRNHFEYTTMPR